LLDPIYASLGVPATLTVLSITAPLSVTAIDDTAGVVIDQGKLGLQTIHPAASLRRRELTSLGVTQTSELIGGTISLRPGTADQADWRIESYASKPNPSGETAGEVQLILVKAS
jgi:hypothetical protein